MMLPFIRRPLGQLNSWFKARNIHTSNLKLNSVKQSPLFILRQRTGLAYNLCREALDKHNNDVDQASSWLQAQALALGLKKATKVRDRNAVEGLIGLHINHNNNLASLMVLNCETDFVAKNQIFKDFALSIMEQIPNTVTNSSSIGLSKSGSIEIYRPMKPELDNIDAQIPPLISKLGENIKLADVKHFKVIESEEHIFGHIHALAHKKETDSGLISVGRFGALVALKSLKSIPGSELKTIGDRLCRHVIGYNPTYIELPEEIRKQLELAEKEKQERLCEIEKDLLEDREAEDSDEDKDSLYQSNDRDDWPSMLDQTLILSDDLSVRTFCEREGINITHFERMECGQN